MTTETAKIKFFNDYNSHVDKVKTLINVLCENSNMSNDEKIDLVARSMNHDKSKINDYNEFESYMNMTIELENVPFGTEKHKEITAKYSNAITIHYRLNDHHPEHFKNGVADMNNNQIREMVCDWCAAMMCRIPNVTYFDISSGIHNNIKRFNIESGTAYFIGSIVGTIKQNYKI